jgi:hypothetical protein
MWRSSSIPSGTASAPAISPVPATQLVTMVMVCRGVIPMALNKLQQWRVSAHDQDWQRPQVEHFVGRAAHHEPFEIREASGAEDD